jgi:thioredoxin-dependent peroxiredoxin
MITIGERIPDFSLESTNGAVITNQTLLGTWTIFYFYPKDETPGCTVQACSIRDSFAALSAAGASVYGISPDSLKKHLKFKEKFALPFDLLVDTDHAFSELCGFWVEKSLYGKSYFGIERSSIIIDPTGNVRGVYRKVQPLGHAGFLLESLRKLQENTPSA